MPRQPAATGLFGETPHAVRQAQINERLQRAQMIGNLGPGGHGALAGGSLGQGISTLMGAPQDPRLKQAQTLQSIEQEMSQMGLEPGTSQFTKTLGQLMLSRMGPAAAAKAVGMAQELEKQTLEVQALRGGPAKEARQRDGFVRLLDRLGHRPEESELIAEHPEIAKALIKGGFTPEKLTAAQKDLAAAQADGSFPKDKGLFDFIEAKGKAGAANLSNTNILPSGQKVVNFEGKLGKLYNDLQKAKELLPPGPDRDALTDSIYKEIEQARRSMEMQRSDERMGTVQSIKDVFNKVADANPKSVGLGGIWTELKTMNNALGAVLRTFDPTTEDEGALVAMAAQMKGLLGTALSGAAIPEREWPTYYDQVPGIKDDRNLRIGKSAAYDRMMMFLLERSKAKIRQDLGEKVNLPQPPADLFYRPTQAQQPKELTYNPNTGRLE